MRLILRLLIFALLFSLVIIGLGQYYLELLTCNEIKRAILAGYPGTSDVEVELNINWLQGGLKGNIDSLKINIDNWSHDKWVVNNFQGHFRDIKINRWQLYYKRQLVIEKIGQGNVELIINENNLNRALSHYYRGLQARLNDERISIDIQINILGYELTTSVHGQLKPGQGAELYFVPEKIDIANYLMPESIRKELLQKLKIPLSIEKTPFTFQVTTVKIMQDKIIIKGKV